jgi:hypothetical protein
MNTRIALSLAALLAGAGLSACGGDDPASTCNEPPLALTQGRWCITITGTSNTCGDGIAAPFWADLTQTGSTLSMTSQYGITYAGALCGSTGTVAASGPPADAVISLAFSSADAGSGTAQWDTGSCTGTDTFTTASGSCP